MEFSISSIQENYLELVCFFWILWNSLFDEFRVKRKLLLIVYRSLCVVMFSREEVNIVDQCYQRKAILWYLYLEVS